MVSRPGKHTEVRIAIPDLECIKPEHVPYLRSAQVFACVVVHHEHVSGLHQLFLYAGRRDIDVVAMTNGGATASSGHLVSIAVSLLPPLSFWTQRCS